ncbi:hypothetical protein QN355_06410 [Cryobacterium sp. 10S3]|uniref:hypothetical protein n=1 Tax=Cryobacterium sp. 10S3 TaxID=3048582 RepID=UPI002AC9379D|nr:hypothetical protein [Cryobacterium sp. 10S3]MEB0286181.1 hypothetical protein [Cryobacterium sp. 10S3]WPX12239.1 hypothetical protein RHM57_11150 [Cryobacterium sp. 10S3]
MAAWFRVGTRYLFSPSDESPEEFPSATVEVFVRYPDETKTALEREQVGQVLHALAADVTRVLGVELEKRFPDA